MSNPVILLRRDQYLELEKLGVGAFRPLDGFMTESQFDSVVKTMRLPSGGIFPLPVLLDVSEEDAARASRASVVTLEFEGVKVGEVVPESIFSINKPAVVKQIFGTDDPAHPGIRRFIGTQSRFIGGKTTLLARVNLEFSQYELTPEQTKARFAQAGWKTVVGFQTRNVPHRAHEYLQRICIEHFDGLFIQPLVGQKKAGDYTPEAILAGYTALIENYYPSNRVMLGILSTSMRYAGPREAVFHALIRRNYGCSHFIVGRDHAGVGNYYGKYEAQELLGTLRSEIGIEILSLSGPFYCEKCDGIATERSCTHFLNEPGAVTEISGTIIRQILSGGMKPEPHYIRPDIVAALPGAIFIEESDP